MNYKFLFILLVLSSSLATCFDLVVGGDRFVEVYQNEEQKIGVLLYNNCDSDKTFDFSFNADMDIDFEPKSLRLLPNQQNYVVATIKPGSIEPGLYEATVTATSYLDSETKSFAVKVKKSGTRLLYADVPEIMRIKENTPFVFGVVVENRGDSVINNIIVKVDGVETKYDDSIKSLRVGEKKFVEFSFDGIELGSHNFTTTLTSGNKHFTKSSKIISSIRAVPVTTSLNVKAYRDEGYLIDYTVRNDGEQKLNDLFVTVADAPSTWDVVSPSKFDLASGEEKSVEVLLKYDEFSDATVTVDLYRSSTLLAQDEVELSLSSLSATGLITFGEGSFLLGLLLIAGILYLKRESVKQIVEHYTHKD